MNHTSLMQKFGITNGETEMLMSLFNGTEPRLDYMSTSRSLAGSLHFQAGQVETDMEEFGFDPAFLPKEATPQAHRELAQKIEKLADWQSTAITFFVYGMIHCHR